MKLHDNHLFAARGALQSRFLAMLACRVAISGGFAVAHGAETNAALAWRPLPLIAEGKVPEVWRHVGWGGFVVDEGCLRTEREPQRPETDYLGLQNHDPGDVVWFREISVRPLPAAEGK